MPDIIDTSDIAQAQAEDGVREWDEKLQTNAVASDEEKPGGISFHVQMRDWTVNDMEELIVEAAARMIVGRTSDNKLSKLIEDRALALITERADAKLSAVAADILGTTLTPAGFGQKSPVTIGETLEHLGREYLSQPVKHDGKPATDYYEKLNATPRIEQIIANHFQAQFAKDIKEASDKAVREVTTELRARHEQVLAAEKARIYEALAKL